jgi:bifunctional aspartokinase / homoserine dehydrogenase 1
MHSQPKPRKASESPFNFLPAPAHHRAAQKASRATQSKPLHVLKFGGTSVGDAACIENVLRIISSAAQKTQAVVVVSAMAGVTNQLMSAAASAAAGNTAQAAKIFQELRLQHQRVAAALIPAPAHRHQLTHRMRTLFNEGEYLCQAASLAHELTPQMLDSIASLGERLSASLVATALAARGLTSEAITATELIATDANYGAANPCIATTRQLCQARLAPPLRHGVIPVVTGFIGATPEGTLTTLGRGGSDYSATILAAALDASEVTIWTDVNGVLTADPRLVPTACTIPEISYSEASDLAHFGAKVLHPKTLQPVMQSDIPVWIRNSFAPENPGTRISPSGTASRGEVKAITTISEAQLITLHGPAAEVPEAPSRAKAAVSALCDGPWVTAKAYSRNEFLIAVSPAIAERAALALRVEFAEELAEQRIDRVSIGPVLAIVTLVGQALHNLAEIRERAIAALHGRQIQALAIADQSSDGNWSLLVAQQDANHALTLLHQEFQLGELVSEELAVKTL